MFNDRRRAIATAVAAISVISGPLLLSAAPAAAQPRLPAERSARFAGIVMDASTGDVLYEKRADAQRFPASISKLMTFYLAFEQMAAGRLKPTDMITVSPHAAAQPRTNLGMHAGQKISVENALLGMATHSANDMATAIAEKIGGTQANFAAMMNRKAQQLGMKSSYFDNPNGLPDPRQVSTARDLAILCRALVRDFPQYYSLFDTRSFTWRGRTLRNTNHLLGVAPGVDGIKTGTTNAAGHNIAVSGVRDGRRLIVVVLGAPSGPSRDLTAEEMLSSGFATLAREGHGAQTTLAQAQPQAQNPAQNSAQNQAPYQILHQATPAAPETAAAPIAQGDADDDETAPEVHAGPAEHAAGRASRWTVQVGVFRARLQAQRYLVQVARRYERELQGAQPRIVGRRHGPFKAQFVSLSEQQAKSACEALSASGRRCLRMSSGA